MFDIAYECEAAVVAAERIKDSLWQKVLKLDLSVPLVGFVEACAISRMDLVIQRYSVLYSTHGGC